MSVTPGGEAQMLRCNHQSCFAKSTFHTEMSAAKLCSVWVFPVHMML